MIIRNLTDLTDEEYWAALKGLKEIFFTTSSRQNFSNNGEKEQFFKKWTSLYIQYFKNEIFFIYEPEIKTYRAYLTGCFDSHQFLKLALEQHPDFATFSGYFKEFPAHLHINCAPEAQGKGYGRILISHYINQLKIKKIPGVHIVTSQQSSNVEFYKKIGFSYIVDKELNNHKLRFMGMNLK